MRLRDSLFGSEATVISERNFQLLLLANIFPAIGTALLSPVLDTLIEPLGASPATIGLMVSFFTAPAIFVIPLAGVLADRYGRRLVLAASLTLFGFAGSAIALTTNFALVLGLRMIQGVAFAGLTPILVTSVGDLYAGTREATAQGLRFSGSGLAQMVFPLLAGVLVAIRWRYPFFLFALAIPTAVIFFRWYDEPATDSTTGTTGQSIQSSDGLSYRKALFDLVRHRRVLALTTARALGPIVWISFLTYNSVIVIRVINGTPSEAGVLVAIGSLVFAASASQSGRVTEIFGSRYVPLLISNTAQAVGFGVVLLAPGIPIAAAGIVIVGVGFGIEISLYRSIITGIAPTALRAGFVSVAEAASRVVITLTPIVIGWAIAVTRPVVGLSQAVQLSILSIILFGSAGRIGLLIIARVSPQPPTERMSPVDG
ncbi:MFS transporter [Halomarina salina]|uniref:MFS transporter n=1 Tax=Halomarina salina TaxID=1872699 RepID=A0ABD5RTT8_9EURY